MGVWLTHHWHQQGHGAFGCRFQKSVPISDSRCYGHLSRTPSALTGPWSARMPRQASVSGWLGREAGSHTIGSNWYHGPRRCLDQPRHIPCAAAACWLAHHRHQPRLGVPRCLDQPRHMPWLLQSVISHTIGIIWSLVRQMPRHMPGLARQLARSPSAAAGPWCEQMPRAASTWCAQMSQTASAHA